LPITPSKILFESMTCGEPLNVAEDVKSINCIDTVASVKGMLYVK